MNYNIEASWNAFFEAETKKKYFIELQNKVDVAYKNSICYPPKDLIFNAFNKCPLNKLNVVIIGQDPYHGPNEANGLCFSVNDGITIPPSLKNIYKEIALDLDTVFAPINGDLEHWAKQGVLLLNATLSVEANKAASHQKMGWETFTDAVIDYISTNKENIVFLLWGGFAHKKAKNADRTKHFILESGHPSPLSANRGFWFGCEHFSKTNVYLKSIDKKEIIW